MKDKIFSDIKDAMRSKEKVKLLVLRGLMACIKQIEVDTREDVTDAQVVEIIQKEIKKRRDSIMHAEKADRTDIIDENTAEIAILQPYLGEQLSEEELKELITDLISNGSNNIGAIMGALNKDHKGKFEGKIASGLIKSLLA